MEKLSPEARADQFIRDEKQFQLGFLITEQSHPKTRGLSDALARDTAEGLEMLYSVDGDIPPVFERVIGSEPFEKLVASIRKSLLSGGRIIFSGCGATGRLAILLDAANRRFWTELFGLYPSLKEKVGGWLESTGAVMTGGDYALVKSVESFEDYAAFGYRQMAERNLTADDTVVAISEGGETSSVIGTIHAGLDAGARTHFLFNNPAELMAERIVRSREVIENDAVNVIDLTTGPMGIAGSTRMQATTIEMLVAGSAFELALAEAAREKLAEDELRLLGVVGRTPKRTAEEFRTLLARLRSAENLKVAADYIDFEAAIYEKGGRVTYFADRAMIDIFTDTTERSPTFKIPPFRADNDTVSPAPWALVKDPTNDSVSAWKSILFHTPNCISWTPAEYRQMGAPESIAADPPKIGVEELYRFQIGNEPDASRTEVTPNAAVALLLGDEACVHAADAWRRAYDSQTEEYQTKAVLAIGPSAPNADGFDRAFFIDVELPKTPLDLFGHIAPKLALNNISSATMGKLGRLSSNWMAHVAASNKKLIDRSIRLASELGGADYRTAAVEFFRTLDELEQLPPAERGTVSPAARAAANLRKRNGEARE
ncbi:MAG: hypothetical protein J6S40_06040 [Thermoguttaceae bacterium]|nr:hypothetical protein [Thermoguttaceae bacterium]